MSIEIKDTETEETKTITGGITLEIAVEAIRIGCAALSAISEGQTLTGFNKVSCGESEAIQLQFQPVIIELIGIEFFQSLEDGSQFYFNNDVITKLEDGLHWPAGTVWTWETLYGLSTDENNFFYSATAATLKIRKPTND